MTLATLDTWWWPFAFILLAGWLPSDVWRAVGTIASGWIDPDGEWLVLVRCIANALVAAVIARIVFTPDGVLAEVPLWARLLAFALAIAIYAGVGYRLFVGILSGQVLLLSAWLFLR